MKKKIIASFIIAIIGIIFFTKNVFGATEYCLQIIYQDYYTGEEISPTITKFIMEGNSYETQQKEIKDYILFSDKVDETAVMPSKNTTIIYKYKYNKCKLTAKYYDDSNNECIKEKTEIGIEGEKSNITQENFEGLHFISTPSESELFFNKKDREIEYHYSREEIPLSQALVRIQYVEKETGKILFFTDRFFTEGTEITSSAEKFNGYELIDKPDKETFKVGNKNMTITYFYEKTKTDFFPKIKMWEININGYFHDLTGFEKNKIELTSSELTNSKGSKIKYVVSACNSGEKTGICNLYVRIPNGYKALQEDNNYFTIDSETGNAYINDISIISQGLNSYELILTKIDNSDPCGVVELNASVKSVGGDINAENDTTSEKLYILPITGRVLFTQNILFLLILILFLMYIVDSVRRKNIIKLAKTSKKM